MLTRLILRGEGAKGFERQNEEQTYAEGLDVVHGELVAEEVEESILEHAAVAVADDKVRICWRKR